jgi:hypothetical protein
VCPEIAIGMGVPRPPIQLVSKDQHIFAVGVDNPELDLTEDLTNFGKDKAYSTGSLCGYIFKSRSPSCGLSDTPIVTEEGMTDGPGIYTSQILAACPFLPVIDETSLTNPGLRDNFLERVFVMERWHQSLIGPPSLEHLKAFHKLHALQLSIHHADMHDKLTRFLNILSEPIPSDAEFAYLDSFMSVLEMSDPGSSRSKLLPAIHNRLEGLANGAELRELNMNAVDDEDSWTELLIHIRSLAEKYGLESLAYQSCVNPSSAETALRFQ